ncbi:MBOAT family protein [Roseiconus nitratireducens]|uniref:MBOAT family protein n=1 Tax=Roseiconus nitratireducens TaxID=2605748 RepID=A0A5M6DEZ6_9BACT|nr:MBOAT family protein [Roseiconus nitratireducens]KAA5546048.1 MBOAT family protein [Roseiconus nitratireducens]
MLFTQIEFLLFLILVILVAWRCPGRRSRNTVLLAASYYFYAYWDLRFCGLLLLSTLVDYWVAQRIDRATDPRIRWTYLCVSLFVNLGVLAFFKYFNFFIESAAAIFHGWGSNPGTLDLVLPVGISFYTFQTLSYTIDVYRGKIAPTRSLLDFALYVAFFPQLVAGPIVRAVELLPQLATVPQWSSGRFYGGFQLALRGLVKKVLLADRLGEMVDVVFAGPELYSGWTVWLAVIGYAGQIYYDFSGYSDIAIGIAKMLGYRFPVNFRHPYLATSLSEFWRRWHITLSRWLRDYLYISLGGNRRGRWRTKWNLMVTMVLGGLWHGAAWTFVLWGTLHGLALVVEHTVRTRLRPGARVGPVIGRMTTLAVVLAGWVLFRSETWQRAATIYSQLCFTRSGIDWFPPLAVLACAILVVDHLLWSTRARLWMHLPADRWYTPTATALLIWTLLLYSPRGFSPFVYFQF